MYEHYPFPLLPLPYSYTALQPYIDCQTLHFHHDKHLAKYVENLNNTLAPYPQFHEWSLEKLLTCVNELPESIRTAVINNGGGVYNHQLYFDLMCGCKCQPDPILMQAIEQSFGSFEKWKEQMKAAAMSQFGSGWANLVVNDQGNLEIVKTANQATPLPKEIILLVDVWEHAYYLQYQNLRDKYVDNWFNVINWKKVCELYRANTGK